MIVTVKLFLAARPMAGKEAMEVALPEGATVGDLARSLREQLGSLSEAEGTCFMINQRAAAQNKVLCHGDCILVLKPLGGG